VEKDCALGNWVIHSADLHFLRLYEALRQKLRSQPLIHGDETWGQVLKEDGRDAQTKSVMWAYRSGQDSEQPIVIFEYQPGCGQKHPQAFLGDYRGLLMSDGYDAWRTLDGAIHLGCMAHARRKFTDALKARKKPGGPPLQALKFFEALYEIERLARQTPSEGETRADYVLRLRQQHSLPVLVALKTWLNDMAPKVLPESFTGKAISYAQNQWDYLIRYTSNGLAPIGKVDDWRGGRRSRGVAVFRRLSPYAGASVRAMVPFPVAACQTGRADFPHPAFSRPPPCQ
jgi:transposase